MDINRLFSFIYSVNTGHTIMKNAKGQIFEIDNWFDWPPKSINETISISTKKEFESAYDFFFVNDIPTIKECGLSKEELEKLATTTKQAANVSYPKGLVISDDLKKQ